ARVIGRHAVEAQVAGGAGNRLTVFAPLVGVRAAAIGQGKDRALFTEAEVDFHRALALILVVDRVGCEEVQRDVAVDDETGSGRGGTACARHCDRINAGVLLEGRVNFQAFGIFALDGHTILVPLIGERSGAAGGDANHGDILFAVFHVTGAS